jgi:outer membrane protein TolC
MKKIITGALLFGTASLFSQQPSNSMTLGIQQAIDLGLKNRYDVQSKKYNAAVANSEVSKSKKEWIPDISGSGNMRYNPQIQATFIPGGFFSPDPSLVSFGAKSLAIFGLDLNQAIYRPGITTDVKIAKNNAALAQERIKQDENTVKEQIVYSYLNILLKDLQTRIATEEEQRYKEYADVAEGKFKLGSMIESDYLKAKLDYENAKVETQKAKQNYDLAFANMKYQVNIPAETEIIVTDTINSPNLNKLQLEAKGDAANRTEIKQLMLKQEDAKLQISKIKQYALPSLSLYGNYSKQFTYTNFDYCLPQWWSSFNYVGLRISVPITANFRNYNSIEEQRIKARQTDLDLKQKVADVNYEIRKAATELNNAQQNMQTTKSNYDLSKQVYENQKQQYNLGSRQYLELLETDRSLNQAEQNYVRAVYDYLISSVNYQKAIGNY